MNNQPDNPPSPQNASGRRTVLIVITVLVVLCCMCTAVTGGGAAAYFALKKPKIGEANLSSFPTEAAVQIEETKIEIEETATLEDTPEPVDTLEPENTRVPENTAEPEPTTTLQASVPGDFEGLGVSREEMIAFYNAGDSFTFGDPMTVQGLEIIQGAHSWLCIESNCAAVTLGGPAEDLLVIGLAVPTNPDDSTQTTLGILLLMTTAARFTDDAATEVVPAQIMEEVMNAQKAAQNMEKTIESSGYEFTVSYDAQTHNAGLAVSRPK